MMLPEGRGRGSTPAGTRTRNLRIRNPLLCPIELRAPQGHCDYRIEHFEAKMVRY